MSLSRQPLVSERESRSAPAGGVYTCLVASSRAGLYCVIDRSSSDRGTCLIEKSKLPKLTRTDDSNEREEEIE